MVPLRLLLETDQEVQCEYLRCLARPSAPNHIWLSLTNSYFATYELIKRSLSGAPATLPNGDPAPAPPLSIGAVMFAGGSAGVAMWSVAIPPDVSYPDRVMSVWVRPVGQGPH